MFTTFLKFEFQLKVVYHKVNRILGMEPSTTILRSANVDVFSNNQCEGWLREFDPSFRMQSKNFCAGLAYNTNQFRLSNKLYSILQTFRFTSN